MRWIAIVNPTAGGGRAGRYVRDLADAVGTSGTDVRIAVATSKAQARALAEEAFARGDGVAAAGGDGTVSHLAALAASRNGRFGILPMGTGNDFARHLGLTGKKMDASVAVLAEGADVVVDLGRATTPEGSAVFCSVASTGFDAEANRWANGVSALHGTPLYVAAMLRTLATYRPLRFAVTVDGGIPTVYEAWLVAFGNGRSYGGGMRVTPQAVLDDGLLDTTIVGPVSRLDLLRTFPRVFRGTHVDHELVTTVRGREFTVDVEDADHPVELYASGDRVGTLPARIEVLPRALRVRVPRASPA